MFCERSLGKFNAKDVELSRKWSVHEFYRLKTLIALKQVNTSVGAKNKNLFAVQNFDGEANCPGVVNLHCMQMIDVMSKRFIFGDDWNDAPCLSRLASWQWLISLKSRPLIFVYLYKRTQPIQKK